VNWKIVAEIGLFFALVYLIARPLGAYLFNVFSGQRTISSALLGWLERILYRSSGVRPDQEQTWFEYALSLLALNLFGMGSLFVMMLVQRYLPLNPQHYGPVEISLALNTAVSFATNTNWQAYVPETTMSYFTQMAGLAVQNFLSAATGMCVAVALIRGFVRKESRTVGNFWVDLVRGTIYILLPIALVGAVFLIGQGVPQNFRAYQNVSPLEGGKQIIPQGPVASQEAIKQLGTNGGGFFNANSAHPYENPTPLSNMIEMLFIIALPAGLIFAFGYFAGDVKQGRSLFNAVFAVMLLTALFAARSESHMNPLLKNEFRNELRWDGGTGGVIGNLEGKETRFGIGQSALFSAVTTSTSCGAVNNMHDSNMPLAGLVEMFNMQLGEIIFGGIGSGLYTLLLFGILTVFVAGLMVGRTPEYLGKKIGPRDMQLTVAAVLLPSALILIFTALVVFLPRALGSVSNPGPHGFSQLLYAYTSAGQNNGSAFAGLNANTPFWNLTLAFCMLLGRFVPIVLVLKLAANLARKKTTPLSLGTLPTGNLLFSFMLIMIIIIIGGLTFFPALAIGPLAEHLLILKGIGF
jgi:K+-transporting ATPase ATPase A chain